MTNGDGMMREVWHWILTSQTSVRRQAVRGDEEEEEEKARETSVAGCGER